MKKLTAVILGVFILCFAPVANAAKSKETKTPQFSMLELGKKLNKIILKKHPEAHASSSGYYVSACNVTLAKDSSNGPQSCDDSRVQPRPESADFKLKLSRHTDPGHFYRIVLRNHAAASEGAPQTIEKRYDLWVIPDLQKSSDLSEKYYNSEVPDVPFNHWLYDDWNRLKQAGVPNPILGPQIPFYKSATRYQFAVAIARLLDQKEKRAKDSTKVKALIADMTFAFEPDLLHLGVPIDHNQIVRDLAEQGIAWQPRHEYLHLNLSCGGKFDRELCKKIEHVIANYAAAWSKSNSSKQKKTTAK